MYALLHCDLLGLIITTCFSVNNNYKIIIKKYFLFYFMRMLMWRVLIEQISLEHNLCSTVIIHIVLIIFSFLFNYHTKYITVNENNYAHDENPSTYDTINISK